MPVWHASLSLQQRGANGGTRWLSAPSRLERAGIALLAGVGATCEWWYYRRSVHVGHLRVGVSDAENALIPVGLASADAGEAGRLRPRTAPQHLPHR